MPNPPRPDSSPRSKAATVAGQRVTVDGLSRTAGPRPPVARPRPSRPLPKAVEVTQHHQAVIHPHPSFSEPHVSHPSLPLPTRQVLERVRKSVWQGVILPSFREKTDRRAVLAGAVATFLSGFLWLLILTPALVLAGDSLVDQPLSRVYGRLYGWLHLVSPMNLLVTVGIVMILATFIWILRHTLLLVSYGVHIRRIDHRLASGRLLFWQAISRTGRFAVVAFFDLLLTTGVILSGVVLIRIALTNPAQWFIPYQSFIIGLILLGVATGLWVLSIHRPLTRVMLAITDRPASYIIMKSFGLVTKNRKRGFLIGLFWLLLAGLTAAILFGILWATSVYGLVQVKTTLGRVALLTVAGFLSYITACIFTIWSQGFWPHAYHALAHSSHAAEVSDLMTGDQVRKSRRKALAHLALFVVSLAAILVVVALFVRQPLDRLLETGRSKLPATLEDALPSIPRPQ